jgi:GR25 family glycosyltransferase involved in LPS biosynthesis
MFNSILAHYRCYKIAQSMNYERVLILEDDVMFLKQKELMSDILEASPSSDVVLYDKFTCSYKSLD